MQNKTGTNLINFSFENKEIRTVFENNVIWFCAKDVCEILDMDTKTNIRNHLQKVPDEWKGNNQINTPGGIQDLLFLSEPGLNFFLFRSNKPKALPFQKWLAKDVIPSIRKSGSYLHPAAAEILSRHGMQDIFNCDSPEQLEEKILKYKSNALVTTSLEAVNKIEITMSNLTNITNQIQANLTPEQRMLLDAKKTLASCEQMKNAKSSWSERFIIYYSDSRRLKALHEIYIHQIEKINFQEFFNLMLGVFEEKFPILKT
ncbi:MAG: hypothetical protein JW915_24175 [Chitinispirillaceae bacterium]|nr:hypothetical protein [Chitinispirillaceae bacterium]